jgi:predicted HTH domain antitoxin
MSTPNRTLRVSVELPIPAETSDLAAVSTELRLLWIIEQVRLHRLGVGKAAELADMPRAAFMQLLGAHGVPVIDHDAADLQGEFGSLSNP